MVSLVCHLQMSTKMSIYIDAHQSITLDGGLHRSCRRSLLLEPGVGRWSWPHERGSQNMLLKLLFCANVVVEVCSWSALCRGGRLRWLLELSLKVVVGA